MKVLKPGRDQSGHSVEAECTGKGNNGGGCGALLLVEQPDMRYSAGGGYFDRDPTVSFRCCSCGVVTDLPEKKWPPRTDTLQRYTANWAAGKDEPNPR